ncbi:helix-turn-helix domain-containing protein [Reinekea sp. G2M2-21]|uniref:AraC family transcriptional regulator n=1 Tax=Reinekea sp. G2M2-21 TaxID=2788942 RepID=UPI0018AA5246|nr:helix-turn-helix domain-containing protein [Reinekea sp. G2M2-21]
MISNLTALTFLIGGLQGLMLTAALFPLRKQHTAFKYLIWLIGLLSFDTLSQLLFWGDLHKAFPHWLGITSFFPSAYGPLFYLYVHQLLRPATRWGWKLPLLFSAIILSYLLNVNIYTLSGPEKARLVETISLGEMPITIAIGQIMMLSSLGFVIAAILRLRHDRKIGIRSQWIDWVWIMSIFQLVIWLFVILNLFTPYNFNGLPYILVSLMIYVLGYKALFAERAKPTSAATQESTQKSAATDTAEKEKYGGNRLDADLQAQIWQELEHQLQQERLYTNPELRIADLAAKTGFQTHVVSQVINDCRAQNFNELINEMRIEEAKRLLLAEPGMSVQSVMEAAGFQAKSTFNTLFKQAVGQTPSVFRKQTKAP